MKTIRVSEDVWHAIIRRARSGETVDEVLRRTLRVKVPEEKKLSPERGATSSRNFIAKVIGDKLLLVIGDGGAKNWRLPPRNHRTAIGKILKSAKTFAHKQGVSSAQAKQIEKMLADARYYPLRQGGRG